MKTANLATVKFREIQFSDSDIVNLDDYIPAGEYNPHNVRPWLIHDHGFVVTVVFASCEQDALDEAVDSGKMDRFQVKDSDLADYKTGKDSEGCPEYEGLTFLGNASEAFDVETLGMEEMPNPRRSFVALFNADRV